MGRLHALFLNEKVLTLHKVFFCVVILVICDISLAVLKWSVISFRDLYFIQNIN